MLPIVRMFHSAFITTDIILWSLSLLFFLPLSLSFLPSLSTSISSLSLPLPSSLLLSLPLFLPLSSAHRPVPATSDMDLSVMRNRIAELKAQIGKENTRDRSGSQPEREGSFVSVALTAL